MDEEVRIAILKEEPLYLKGIADGKALCAAGPWQYTPNEPPRCRILIESGLIEGFYFTLTWDHEACCYRGHNRLRVFTGSKESWKRWAVINEEIKP